MTFKTTQNTFNQGMNKDSDHRVQANSTYRDAKNITVMGENDFFSAKNMAGTKELETIIPSSAGLSFSNVLGAFECKATYYSYGGELRHPSVVIFTTHIDGGSAVEVSSIKLYDIERDVLHTLLVTTAALAGTNGEELAFPLEGTIDAVVFGEKNFDRIYFDDHKNPLRDFNITDQPIPNARSLTTRPLAPVDEITYLRQETGSGQLASGTYQFSYRYYNTETKKYSTWSLLTLGIPIFPIDFAEVDSLDEVYGGVPNELTKKSIVLEINKTAEYSINYDAVQLAVIKNVDGLKQPSAVAFLTSVNKDWFNDPTEIIYDGQGLETTVDSQEIVTEDAAIESAKTLVAKDNVLFRGNVKYLDRVVDNITFSDAQTISQKLGTAGTRYSLIDPNTNNPTFNNISGSQAGVVLLDGAGNPVDTNYVIAYNGFLDIRQGDGWFGADIVDGRVTGGSTDGDTADTNCNLTIPANIQPGNEIFLKLVTNEFGMREWPSLAPGNDEWGFQAQALRDLAVGGFFNIFLSGLYQFLISPLYSVLTLGSDTDSNQQVVAGSFRYIVQENDTPISVAKNIFEQLSASVNANEFMRMNRSGSTLEFRVENKRDERFGVNNDFRPFMFLEYGMGNGIDITVQDDEAELNDLINNPDSIQGGYKNPANAHRYKGYFRDEAYRFAAVYMDKYSNWSRPVPFDFSQLRARNSVGTTFNVTNIDHRQLVGAGGASGLSVVTINSSSHGIEKGDLVLLELGPGRFEYREVRLIEIGSANSVTVAGTLVQTPGFPPVLTKLRGGEYSWSEDGTDWRFPKRKNFKYPMMCAIAPDGTFDQTNTFINPIGLRISGITNHPDWAVALAIVRVRRLKNIIWQSPAIATQAVMPSIYAGGSQGFCGGPIAGSSPLGTYGPKSFAKGVAFHIDRLSPSISITNSYTLRRRPWKEEENVPKLITVVPPEHMYQWDGSNFGSGLTPSGATIEIVDAVTYFRTWEFDVDGSGADDGDNTGDQLAFGIRADNAYNYYYKDMTGAYDVQTYPFLVGGGNTFAVGQAPSEGRTKALFYGGTVNLGAPVSLPAPPTDIDFRLKSVVTYGNLEATSTYNCSNEVTLQKSIVILTGDEFGDFSYYCRQAEAGKFLEINGIPVGRPDFQFHYEPSRAPINSFGNIRFNVGRSGFEIGGNEIGATTPGNRITDLVDGASAAAPIINLVRDISDDRYGKLEEVHEFIHTGAYAKISSPSDVIDLDVWGGDCFISKHAAKISDTHLDQTQSGTDDGATRTFAYNDFQEILMTYLESTVNCEMQGGQFHYPVLQRQALQVFAPSYDYNYNPGYSVENELKVWVTRSNIEENRTVFPARIIYSDQKVFQTDIEGFDRFRAFSFYDLPEDYGGITKLTKLPNDNMYIIQESAVAVIPINKNVIEDSTGGQLVVNSNTLINTPNYILNQNGSQHIRSVINSDTSIFFLDAAKREVFKLGGQGSDGKISENGMHSEFLDRFESNIGIPDHLIVSGYDLNNGEYWIGAEVYTDSEFENNVPTTGVKERVHLLWSDKLGAWMTEVTFAPEVSPKKVVYSGSELYILGQDINSELVIEEMYGGDIYGQWLKSAQESSIKFVINADEPFGKTFDVLRIDSNNRCDRAEALIYREEPLAPLQTSVNLDRRTRHDSYEVPLLLAQNNQRMRGKACEMELFISNNSTTEVRILNVLTKYRLSSRVFK